MLIEKTVYDFLHSVKQLYVLQLRQDVSVKLDGEKGWKTKVTGEDRKPQYHLVKMDNWYPAYSTRHRNNTLRMSCL